MSAGFRSPCPCERLAPLPSACMLPPVGRPVSCAAPRLQSTRRLSCQASVPGPFAAPDSLRFSLPIIFAINAHVWISGSRHYRFGRRHFGRRRFGRRRFGRRRLGRRPRIHARGLAPAGAMAPNVAAPYSDGIIYGELAAPPPPPVWYPMDVDEDVEPWEMPTPTPVDDLPLILKR